VREFNFRRRYRASIFKLGPRSDHPVSLSLSLSPSLSLARARARARSDDALLSPLSLVLPSRWPAGSNETKPWLASLLPARALVPRATFLPDGDLCGETARARYPWQRSDKDRARAFNYPGSEPRNRFRPLTIAPSHRRSICSAIPPLAIERASRRSKIDRHFSWSLGAGEPPRLTDEEEKALLKRRREMSLNRTGSSDATESRSLRGLDDDWQQQHQQWAPISRARDQ